MANTAFVLACCVREQKAQSDSETKVFNEECRDRIFVAWLNIRSTICQLYEFCACCYECIRMVNRTGFFCPLASLFCGSENKL